MIFLRKLLFFSILSSIGFLASCNKKPAVSPVNPQSAKTFDATSAYLDIGGDFYLYLRTEQILSDVPAIMDEWKGSIMEAVGPNVPLTQEQIDAYYNVVKKAVVNTGITQLRAFGMSSIELKPWLSRNKSIAYSGPIEGRGLLWQLGSKSAPHSIAALDFLPATTAYTVFTDFDPQMLWVFIQQILKEIPNESVQAQVESLPVMAEKMLGMPLSELFASLDSEFGVVITADETAKMTLPFCGKPTEIPRTDAALLIRVTNDKLYELLVAKLENTLAGTIPVNKSDDQGSRMATVQMPKSDLPLKPTIARFGSYLAIATTDELALQLARKGSSLPLLMKDTPDFQRFAKFEKLEANSFVYLTERGSKLLRDLQLQSLDSEPGLPPALKPNIEKIYRILSQDFVFSLGRIEKDGYATVTYSSNGMEPAVAMTGAIVIPAITNSFKANPSKPLVKESSLIHSPID